MMPYRTSEKLRGPSLDEAPPTPWWHLKRWWRWLSVRQRRFRNQAAAWKRAERSYYSTREEKYWDEMMRLYGVAPGKFVGWETMARKFDAHHGSKAWWV